MQSPDNSRARLKSRHPRVGQPAAAFIVLIALSITVFLPGLSGCATLPSDSAGNTQPGQAKPKPADKGDFKVVYLPVKNPEYAKLLKELKDAKVLEQIAADLNATIALPFDVSITFAECGQVNAFYDPEKRRISMCFELLEHFSEIFAEDAKSEDELGDAVVGATVFVLFHELGHALIHVLDLPVTGKEEDAVDQLSTFVLTDGTDEGEKAVLDGARWFILEDEQQDKQLEELAFWDEHSLNAQRFYNLVCWVYGQNPAKYQNLIKNGALPAERAGRCEGEYQQLAKSWATLLGPHLKK